MTAFRGVAVSMLTTVSREGEVRDAISDGLVALVADAGFVPVAVPNRPEMARRILAESIGLILSGGVESVDADGSLVGDRRRDTERELLRLAFARELPVLGICRGTQVINAYLGGDLRTITPPGGHVATEHPVDVRGERIASLLGPLEALVVNSFHDDGIARLGRELRVAAVAPDGQIEAIEHQTHPVVGLMWHPERGCSDVRFARAHTGSLCRLFAWKGAQR